MRFFRVVETEAHGHMAPGSATAGGTVLLQHTEFSVKTELLRQFLA